MANQLMTAATELAVLIPEIWSADFYPALVANLPFIEVVDQNYSGSIQALGDTVNISQFPEFSGAQELAEDGTADSQAVTVTQNQLVINKQIVLDFAVTRVATLQSLPALNELNKMAMFAVMKKIQQLIIDTTSPSSSSPIHTIAYDTGTTLVLADILEAKELLDAQNVDGMNRVGVLGSAQKNDLLNVTNFISRDYIPAGSPMSSGDILTPVCGFGIRDTTVVSNTSYWFHPSYLTMAIQERPAVEVFNLGGQGQRATRVNLTALCGFKQLDSKRVVSIS